MNWHSRTEVAAVPEWSLRESAVFSVLSRYAELSHCFLSAHAKPSLLLQWQRTKKGEENIGSHWRGSHPSFSFMTVTHTDLPLEEAAVPSSFCCSITLGNSALCFYGWLEAIFAFFYKFLIYSYLILNRMWKCQISF